MYKPGQPRQPGAGRESQVPGGMPGMFGYLTSTSGTLAYPGMPYISTQNQRPLESMRPMEGTETTASVKRRPSMMSDFFASSSHQPMPAISGIDVTGRRMADARMSHHDSRRMGPAYTPQVENISPTPEDQPKTVVAERLERVEREIRGVDGQIKNLERKKQELEKSAERGPEAETEETVTQSLFERIYSENRKKAAESHALFEKIGFPDAYPAPLYHEPSDTEIYHQIEEKHKTFRPLLIEYIKKLKHAREMRERYLTARYNTMMQAWKKKVERWENKPTKKAKDAKNRELFEAVFPELKKQREDKERNTRTEARTTNIMGTRSDVVDQPLETAIDQEEDNHKLRQQAVVPPLMLDARTQARQRYVNNNGLVLDPLGDHQFRLDMFIATWCDEEKKIFREKILTYGKNFAAISVFLERKTTRDCVRYYYMTKKRENYKQMMRKQYRKRKQYRPPEMPRLGDAKDESSTDADTSQQEINPKPEVEHVCVLCKTKIDPASNPGRVLTRACYETYGLDPEDANPQDVKICQKCRLGSLKKKYINCPIGTCTTAKRKVRPTRQMPPKWKELSPDQKQIVCVQMQMTEDMTKCCSACHKRLGRVIDAVINGDEELILAPIAPIEEEDSRSSWNADETGELRNWTEQIGTANWDEVAAKLSTNRTPDECKRHFATLQEEAESKRTAKPTAAKVAGIESEDEDNSDLEENNTGTETEVTPATSVANLDVLVQAQEQSLECHKLNQTEPLTHEQIIAKRFAATRQRELSHSQESVRSSGDSCATLSADEGQSETERKSPKRAAPDPASPTSTQPASSELPPAEDICKEKRETLERSKPKFHKPKFHHTNAAESEMPESKVASVIHGLITSEIKKEPQTPVVLEGLSARIPQVKIEQVKRSDSPDVQIIRTKPSSQIPGRMIPKSRTPPPNTRQPTANPPIRGSITHGTPVLRAGLLTPSQLPPSAPPASRAYESLLRPSTPFAKEELSRPGSRLSPLVLSRAEGQQAYTQHVALAQQSYLQARQMGYPEQQAFAIYQQALATTQTQQRVQHELFNVGIRQLQDDFRSSLHMTHAPAAVSPSQSQDMLQRQIEMQRIAEQQRIVEHQQRIAEQQHRLAQEQQRAVLMANIHEQSQRAALYGQQMRLAAECDRKRQEAMATAAVVEHHQRALAEAQRAAAQRMAQQSLGVLAVQHSASASTSPAPRLGRTPELQVKTEPKTSPLVSPAMAAARSSVPPQTLFTDVKPRTVAQVTSSASTVIQSAHLDNNSQKRGPEPPFMTKGAMKEFPLSLQTQTIERKQSDPIPVSKASVSPVCTTTAPVTVGSYNMMNLIESTITDQMHAPIVTTTAQQTVKTSEVTPVTTAPPVTSTAPGIKELIDDVISDNYGTERINTPVCSTTPTIAGYDFEPVSPVDGSPQQVTPEPACAHVEQSLAEPEASRSAPPPMTVYNVFSLPPAALDTAPTQAGDTPVAQTHTEREHTRSEPLNSSEQDREAAAAVQNLPTYEPLSDDDN